MAIVNCYIVHKEMANRLNEQPWKQRKLMEKLQEAFLAVTDDVFKPAQLLTAETIAGMKASADDNVEDTADEQSDVEGHTVVECTERKKNNRLKRYRCKVCYAWRHQSKQGDFDTKFYCKECTEDFDGKDLVNCIIIFTYAGVFVQVQLDCV